MSFEIVTGYRRNDYSFPMNQSSYTNNNIASRLYTVSNSNTFSNYAGTINTIYYSKDSGWYTSWTPLSTPYLGDSSFTPRPNRFYINPGGVFLIYGSMGHTGTPFSTNIYYVYDWRTESLLTKYITTDGVAEYQYREAMVCNETGGIIVSVGSTASSGTQAVTCFTTNGGTTWLKSTSALPSNTARGSLAHTIVNSGGDYEQQGDCTCMIHVADENNARPGRFYINTLAGLYRTSLSNGDTTLNWVSVLPSTPGSSTFRGLCFTDGDSSGDVKFIWFARRTESSGQGQHIIGRINNSTDVGTNALQPNGWTSSTVVTGVTNYIPSGYTVTIDDNRVIRDMASSSETKNVCFITTHDIFFFRKDTESSNIEFTMMPTTVFSGPRNTVPFSRRLLSVSYINPLNLQDDPSASTNAKTYGRWIFMDTQGRLIYIDDCPISSISAQTTQFLSTSSYPINGYYLDTRCKPYARTGIKNKLKTNSLYILSQVIEFGNTAVESTSLLPEKIINYASDIPSRQTWTYLTFTITGSKDDGYVNESIPMGMTWGWNGSNYTSFKVNTNGQVQFSNFNNSIANYTDLNGIVAFSGDLYLDSLQSVTAVNKTALISGIQNAIDIATTGYIFYPSSSDSTLKAGYKTISTLSNTQKITVTIEKGFNNDPGYIVFQHNSVASVTTVFPRRLKIRKFEGIKFNTGEVLSLGDPKGTNASFPSEIVIDIVPNGPPVYLEIQNFNANNSYFNSRTITEIYCSDLEGLSLPYVQEEQNRSAPQYPLSLPRPEIYYMNKQWTDNGVTHSICRVVVHGHRYDKRNLYAGWTASFYKAGARQIFSVRMLPYSTAPGTTLSAQNCGPYFNGTAAATLGPNNFYEMSWQSNDNGSSWQLKNNDGSYRSTVVQMGPEISLVGGNIKIFDILQKLQPQRVVPYAQTNAVAYSDPNSVITRPGFGLVNMMDRYIIYRNNATFGSIDSYETKLFNIFSESYAFSAGKNSYYTYYSDIDRSTSSQYTAIIQPPNSTDVAELLLLAQGFAPSDNDSYDGWNSLYNRMWSEGLDFMRVAIGRGWVQNKISSLGSVYELTYPGIQGRFGNKTNVSVSSSSGLGPVEKSNFTSINTQSPVAPASVPYKKIFLTVVT